jgi:hypothetical protein
MATTDVGVTTTVVVTTTDVDDDNNGGGDEGVHPGDGVRRRRTQGLLRSLARSALSSPRLLIKEDRKGRKGRENTKEG